jgi:hypothetical protein
MTNIMRLKDNFQHWTGNVEKRGTYAKLSPRFPTAPAAPRPVSRRIPAH